jgi:hypothetical protein
VYLNGENDYAYEVLNFGRPGAETIDHLTILKDRVLDSKPDFVLVQWFTNDVEGHNKKGKRPIPIRLIPSSFVTELLRNNSALFYLVDQQWVTMQRKLGVIESYNDYMFRHFGNPNSPAAIEARGALQKIIGLCKENRLPVGLVLFSRSYLDGDHILDFLTERVIELCVHEAIVCLDLRTIFASYEGSGMLWANRLDGHPGPLAHRLVAERLVEVFGKMWLAE